MQSEAPNKFDIVHLEENSLMSSTSEDVVLLLKEAERYASNPNESKGVSPITPVQGAVSKFLSPLPTLFYEIMYYNYDVLNGCGFYGFPCYEILLTKSSKIIVKEIFINNMGHLQSNHVDKRKTFWISGSTKHE